MGLKNRARVARRSVVSRIARQSQCISQPFEPLEQRTMLSATLMQQIAPATGGSGSSTTIDLSPNFSDPSITGTFVLMQTTEGNIPIELYDSVVPTTVQNFLNYVNSGEYNNTIFHRVVTVDSGGIGIVQGGGYTTSFQPISTGAPIPLEYDLPNTAGTIAMARTSDPNSATSEWFFNAVDNTDALGQSNGGGYAVFGQVLYNGMDAVNAIYNLPLGQDPNSDSSAAPSVPLQNYTSGSYTAANLVVVKSAAVVSPLTYSATSDNTSLVNPTVSGNNLVLNYGFGVGTANVTVTATDYGGNTATSTFAVTVLPQVTIGAGAGQTHTLRFTGTNGVAGMATISGPGTATISMTGDGLSGGRTGGVATISGTPATVTVTTTGTTAASTLTITGGAAVDSVSVDKNLGTLNASRVTLNGDLSVPGTIGRVALGSVSGNTITVGGSSRALTLALGTASDETVSSAEPITTLSATSWTAPSGSPATISAPSISHINIKGELNAAVSTPGNLGQVTAGSITPSSWTVSGAVTGITARTITGLNVAAGSIGRITDRGEATDDVFNAGTKITAVSALGLSGTKIYAGAPTNDGNGIPTDFPNAATISTVTVGRGGFSDSVIGASSLGNLNLGAINSSNGGVPFGVGAHTINSLVATIDGKRVSARRVTSADQVTAALTKAGVTPVDLVIRIV